MKCIAGVSLPERPDVARMRRERHAKLQEQLAVLGLDAMVLLGTSAVAYATGAATPGADSSRAGLLRPVAIVVLGDSSPHLLTPYTDGAPPELPADHLHDAVYPDLDGGAAALAAVVAERVARGARVAVDEVTHPMARVLDGLELVSATAALGSAKLHKTVDELACIRRAQRINESAMSVVQPLARPGIAQTDLTASFLRAIFDFGAQANGIDPIWQAMTVARAEGPWTTNGDIAFPAPSADCILEEGDVVWVDTGLHYEGYVSDFGRTWIVADDPRPTARQQAQFTRWRDVVRAVLELCKPGVTALELDRAAIAANGGTKPWMEHFYLAHGIGTDSAEMPLVGTDLGEAFDAQLVLEPGMVLVIEPVIWDDGAAGYRAEEIIAITDDGWVQLSEYPYDPFEVAP